MTQTVPDVISDARVRVLQLLSPLLVRDEVVIDSHECRAMSSDVYAAGEEALAVIRPRNKSSVARAVAALTTNGYAIVTRGGGMSYTGGYTPQRPDTVVVDTSALDCITAISAEDLFVTAEAGVTWKRLHEALTPLGLRLPFFGTFSGAVATVGGGLSNGALFLGTARYGTAADCMLGMEVVLADGTLVKTGQAGFRNVTKPFYRTYGPDLSGLFVHDSGTLGIKVAATFRLIRAPEYSGFASFIFPSMQAAARGLSEVARSGAAEEAYVFDPESTRKNLGTSDLQRDAKILLGVVRGESNILKGVRAGAGLIAAGRNFIGENDFSLHVVCTGRTPAALDADLDACRDASQRLGGREIVNSIPKAVRANLFPPPDGVLGPNGDRWAALNAKVAHSDAERLIDAAAVVLAPYADEMRAAGVWMSHLLIAVNSHAFSFEPVFHWFDEWLPMHERVPSREFLAKLQRPAANLAARALVGRLRSHMVQLFAEFGAASNQIGKTYPYLESLQSETAALLDKLKKSVDPGGAMNPGGLGFK